MAKSGDLTAILSGLNPTNGVEDDEFLPTGSVIFDSVISDGRGLPRRKFIQISSESGLGKTTMVLSMCKSLCAKGYICVYIDVEKAVNESQIDGIGLRQYLNKTFFWYVINTFEEAESILDKILIGDDKLALVAVDSITALVPKKIFENSVSSIEPGLQARYASTFLIKYKGILKDTQTKASILFINQMRNKINFMRGGTYEAAGGSAQKFYMDIRLMMALDKKLSKMTTTGEGKADVPFGADVKLWAEKNRFARPFVIGVVTILFGKGVSNISAYQRWLTNKGYITGGGAGWFSVKLPDKEVEKCRGTAELSKWVKGHLSEVKSLVENNGGFLLIQDEEES